MRIVGWLVLALVAGAIGGACAGLLRRRAPASYSDASTTRLEGDAAVAADPYRASDNNEIYRDLAAP